MFWYKEPFYEYLKSKEFNNRSNLPQKNPVNTSSTDLILENKESVFSRLV